jgi:hypothetical protein
MIATHCFFNQTLHKKFELTSCLEINLLDQSQKHDAMFKKLTFPFGCAMCIVTLLNVTMHLLQLQFKSQRVFVL